MPLPLILGIGAGIAALGGVVSGVKGVNKFRDAKHTMEDAQRRNEKNTKKLEESNRLAIKAMDELGKYELEIIETFSRFSKVIELIQNKPEFNAITIDDKPIAQFTPDELNKASIGAGVLLGGLAGAAIGTAGGFAAAGATTAAVMAIGTASTGTAIASLSGVAATNATLAAIGGGAIAAGGGGIALGTTILGASTLGVALLVGGLIFNIAGSKVSNKANDAKEQMLENERKINKAIRFLNQLREVATDYYSILRKVANPYHRYLARIENIVYDEEKTDWNDYSDAEKNSVETCSYLVGLLYHMCKVQIVKKSENSELNSICTQEINDAKQNALRTMDELGIHYNTL